MSTGVVMLASISVMNSELHTDEGGELTGVQYSKSSPAAELDPWAFFVVIWLGHHRPCAFVNKYDTKYKRSVMLQLEALSVVGASHRDRGCWLDLMVIDWHRSIPVRHKHCVCRLHGCWSGYTAKMHGTDYGGTTQVSGTGWMVIWCMSGFSDDVVCFSLAAASASTTRWT